MSIWRNMVAKGQSYTATFKYLQTACSLWPTSPFASMYSKCRQQASVCGKGLINIDWLGFYAVFNNFSVISRRPDYLLMCSWLPHTSNPHNTLPKQLAVFPLVENEWRLSHWLIKCQKKCWPSWDSNSQPLDWQPTSLPRLRLINIVQWVHTAM